MIPTAWRMISRERARFLLTVGGVGFSVILMLFQLGIYYGVKRGATGYVLGSAAEIWMCENNSTNLLRSSSFLQTMFGKRIAQIKGVGEITGILRVLTTARINGESVTLFLFGFDPESRLAAPAALVEGTSRIGPGDIILDRAFAAKHGLVLGDSLQIKGHDFRVTGICEGTNTVVAQFVFTTLEESERLLGFSEVVSFYLLTGNGQTETDELIHFLKESFPDLSVFSKAEFVANNLDEMKSGVLPVLWIIALFGGILGVAIITLMLYGSVLEKREDYALLKAIGANQRFLAFFVFRQSFLGAFIGFLFGVSLYWVITPLIVKLVPEISLVLTWGSVAAVLLASLLIGTLGSLIPVLKLSHIFPMEVFRR